MNGVQRDDSRTDPLVALRSGVASEQFRKGVRDAMAAQTSAELPSDPSAVAISEQAAHTAEPARPLLRQMGRRLLRVLRPLALPFLHRFQMRVSHAVDLSAAVQQQTALLAELRSNFEEMRLQIGRALDFQDGADSVAARLARQEERLIGLQSLAVANINAIGSFAETDRTANIEVGSLLAEIDILQRQQARQRELTERILKSRVVPVGDGVLIRTSAGWLIVPAEDGPLIAAMAEQGDTLEPGTAQVVQAVLEAGDVAIDIGSNVGAILLQMAIGVGPNGRMVAIEPTPRCVDALRKTVAINGLSARCQIIPSAVGATSGAATLHLGTTHSHNSLHAFLLEEGSVEVPVEPLDGLIAEDVVPALIKIDVEGAELDVLAGMHGILDRSPDVALIVEFGISHLERTGSKVGEWLAAFESHGFRAWSIDEATGRIAAFAVDQLRGAPSVNLLMLRDHPARWQRLQLA